MGCSVDRLEGLQAACRWCGTICAASWRTLCSARPHESAAHWVHRHITYPQATVRRGGEYTGGSRGEISFNGDLGEHRRMQVANVAGHGC